MTNSLIIPISHSFKVIIPRQKQKTPAQGKRFILGQLKQR